MVETIDHFEFEPRDAFEFQPGTDPNLILAFLAEDEENSFNPQEIQAATDLERGRVHEMLDHLEHRNLIERDGRAWTIAPPDTTIDWSTPTSDQDRYSGHSGGG